MENLCETLREQLEEVHKGLFAKALAMRESRTVDALDFEAFREGVQHGFVRAAWCGERECEDRIKELYAATSRNYTTDPNDVIDDHCVCCGKPAKHLVYWARAY